MESKWTLVESVTIDGVKETTRQMRLMDGIIYRVTSIDENGQRAEAMTYVPAPPPTMRPQVQARRPRTLRDARR